MNKFLGTLQITFRRDPANNRPRINKRESVKDQEQKKAGNFFFMCVVAAAGGADARAHVCADRDNAD
jgi:hypothetical protein